MKNVLLSSFLAIFVLGPFLLLVGCAQNQKELSSAPDTAPVLAGQMGKETEVKAALVTIRQNNQTTAKEGAGNAKIEAETAAVSAALDAAEAQIAAHPVSEVKEAFDGLLKALADRDALIKSQEQKIDNLLSRNAKIWYWILNGGGVFFALFGVACIFHSAIPVIGPFIGPRMSVISWALSGTCFLLAYLYSWTQANPVKVGMIVTGLLVALGVFVWTNKLLHFKQVPGNA